MELSKRLQAVADLISCGMRVADVGTDHGYIPIYLIKTGKSPYVLAMDINKGPLERAATHIREYCLESHIETRQSDGVKSLNMGECDCVVIAGMGGALTIKILEEGESVFRNLNEFVLQPQSELFKVREYLYTHQYDIVSENMVCEDGKFYPMMRVVNGQSPAYTKEELLYGKYLLQNKNEVLQEYLQKEMHTKQWILESLQEENGAHIETRKRELQEELGGIKDALQRYHSLD